MHISLDYWEVAVFSEEGICVEAFADRAAAEKFWQKAHDRGLEPSDIISQHIFLNRIYDVDALIKDLCQNA
jgi:hypothetical protein